MTKTLHHRACHLCEAICGLTIETTEVEAGVQITSIKGDPLDTFSRGHIAPRLSPCKIFRTIRIACINRCCGWERMAADRVGRRFQSCGRTPVSDSGASRAKLGGGLSRQPQRAQLRADDPQQLLSWPAENPQPVFCDVGRPIAPSPDQSFDVRPRFVAADPGHRSHRFHADPRRQPAGLQRQHHDRAGCGKALESDSGPGRQSRGGRSAPQRNGGHCRPASVRAPRWRCGVVVRPAQYLVRRRPDPRQSFAGGRSG